MRREYNGYLLDDEGTLIHRKVFFRRHPERKNLKGWDIHHMNGIKTDNDIKNLIHLPRNLHLYIHKKFGFYHHFLPKRKKLQYYLKIFQSFGLEELDRVVDKQRESKRKSRRNNKQNRARKKNEL